MAASINLLEVRHRREQLLRDLLGHLDTPLGSSRHNDFVDFAMRSLMYHDGMDVETEKVCIPRRLFPFEVALDPCSDASRCSDRTAVAPAHEYRGFSMPSQSLTLKT